MFRGKESSKRIEISRLLTYCQYWERRLLLRTVHILLECILVDNEFGYFSVHNPSRDEAVAAEQRFTGTFFHIRCSFMEWPLCR